MVRTNIVNVFQTLNQVKITNSLFYSVCEVVSTHSKVKDLNPLTKVLFMHLA